MSLLVGGAWSHGSQKGLKDLRYAAGLRYLKTPADQRLDSLWSVTDLTGVVHFFTMLSQASLTPGLRSRPIWINAGCLLVWATTTFLFFSPLSFSLSSVVRLSAALFVQPMISNTLSLTFWPHVLCVNMCPFDPITFMFLLRVILTVSWLNVIECGRVAVVGFGSVISPTVKCVSQKPLCRMSDRRFHCYEVQTDLFPLKQMPDHTSGFAFPYTHMHLDYFTL